MAYFSAVVALLSLSTIAGHVTEATTGVTILASTTAIAAATVATTAATSAEAAPATAAARTRLRLVHRDLATLQLRAVHLSDGSVQSILIGKGDKTKATRPPSLTVTDNLGFQDLTETAKGLLQRSVISGPGQPAHKSSEFAHAAGKRKREEERNWRPCLLPGRI
jgi:hypothetical protein